MDKFEKETLYGISINGNNPGMWNRNYPSEREIKFNSAPQYESIEIVKKVVTYEKVAKIK